MSWEFLDDPLDEFEQEMLDSAVAEMERTGKTYHELLEERLEEMQKILSNDV